MGYMCGLMLYSTVGKEQSLYMVCLISSLLTHLTQTKVDCIHSLPDQKNFVGCASFASITQLVQ